MQGLKGAEWHRAHKLRYTLSEVRKFAARVSKVRCLGKNKSGKRKSEALISCPIKNLGCTAIEPRWVIVMSLKNHRYPGRCSSCSQFKNGYIDKKGYRRIYISGVKYLEHRFVIQHILGRELRADETVHHKNGNRRDNRPENLELRMSGRHPKGWSLRQMREYLKTIPKKLGGLK